MAMAKGSWSVDQWREYFQSANSDIFDVIEQAMIIAASDHPHEFMMKQDRFQEVLLACKEGCRDDDNGSYEMDESKCILEASRIKGILDNSKRETSEVLHNLLRKLQLMPMSMEIFKTTGIGKSVNALRTHELKEIRSFATTLTRYWKSMVISWMETMEAGSEDPQTGGESNENGLKHSHVNNYQPRSSTTKATNPETMGMKLTPPTPDMPLNGERKPPTPSPVVKLKEVLLACKEGSRDDDNGSYEMDESNCILEVSRIKGILDNSKQESSEVLHNLLRKLQLMPMSMEIFKTTGIGKSVNALRTHELKEIRSFATTLTRDWKSMVFSWMETKEAGSEDPKTGGESDENGLNHSHVNTYQPPSASTKATNPETMGMKLTPPTLDMPLNGERKHPRLPMLVKKNFHTEDSMEMKLEASKRKLQERYQEAENLKKQRTIKVLELSNLPKQRVFEPSIHRQMRWGNRNRR